VDARVTIGTTCSLGIGPAHGGRTENEDNFLVALRGRLRLRNSRGETVEQDIEGGGVLVAVADGMGGHDQGEVASSQAVATLARLWQHGRPGDPERALADWLPRAHAELRQVVSPSGPVNMGTTLSALWIVHDRAGWVHVGDSRLYRMRGGQLWRLSRDQTHAEFAQRDRREPGPNASYPAQSFIFGSRGLGHDAELRIDPGVDTGTLNLAVGDRLLLCSDGISGFVDDDRIASVLARARDPQEAADDLVDLAMESGSDDNVTAVVVHVRSLPVVRLDPDEDDEHAPTPTLPTDDDTIVPWDD